MVLPCANTHQLLHSTCRESKIMMAILILLTTAHGQVWRGCENETRKSGLMLCYGNRRMYASVFCLEKLGGEKDGSRLPSSVESVNQKPCRTSMSNGCRQYEHLSCRAKIRDQNSSVLESVKSFSTAITRSASKENSSSKDKGMHASPKAWPDMQ